MVVEVPLDGLTNAGLEGLSRFPSQLPIDLGSIDGVAAIMTGTIGDVGDLLLVALSIGAGRKLIKDGTEGVDDVEVRLLVPPADVIGLTHLAGLEHATYGGGVVLHIEPVTDLLAVTVDRERLTGEGVVDDQRDELLGEVVGAVIVGAIRREDRKAVGVVVGTDEVVRGGLAG